MHVGHYALTNYLLKLLIKPLPGGSSSSSGHGHPGGQVGASASASAASTSGLLSARVINVASDALLAGNFHPSLLSGSGAGDLQREVTDNCGTFGPYDLGQCCPMMACPLTNGYARAKLANTMHAFELQRRVDDYVFHHLGTGVFNPKSFRRLVTASLHPGTVGTHISWFLDAPLVSPFLRSPDQAAYVVLHAILDDSYVPGSHIDAMLHGHDLFGFQAKHLRRHFELFPEAQSMDLSDDTYTLHRQWWRVQSLVQPSVAFNSENSDGRVDAIITSVVSNATIPITTAATVDSEQENPQESLQQEEREESAKDKNDGVELYHKHTVAARLWDVTDQIVRDWEADKPVLVSVVTENVKLKL
jgi:hypothetical protein